MFTLLSRWKAKNFEHNIVMQELHFLVNGIRNWDEFFAYDETGRIRYCIPYDGENAYGRETGICYSEEAALNAIKFVLNNYAFLLVPWLSQGEESIDLCVDMPEPVAFVKTENGEEKSVFSTMFVFSKCDNKAGFCVSKVVPLLDYKVNHDE